MAKKHTNTTPQCFESASQWYEYQRLYRYSIGTGRINYCLDCLPEYRDRMVCEGRCAHPETVFIEEAEGPVGINGMVWAAWMSAISGKRGNIISKPPRDVRDRFIAEATAENPNRLKVEELREQKKQRKRKAKADE
jgi:hypothetical protein